MDTSTFRSRLPYSRRFPTLGQAIRRRDPPGYTQHLAKAGRAARLRDAVFLIAAAKGRAPSPGDHPEEA